MVSGRSSRGGPVLAEIFGPDLLLILVLFVIPLWAIIDAATRPTPAWRAAGQSKPLWLSLIIGTTLLTGLIGVILSIVYLTVIRPKVRGATA
jgi:hypothetical protein